MANQNLVDITSGPTLADLQMSFKRQYPVTFDLAKPSWFSRQLKVTITELYREDGSGNCWIWGGTGAGFFKQKFSGFYRTNSHTGFMSPRTHTSINTLLGTYININSGPSADNILKSLEGSNQDRHNVYFGLNNTIYLPQYCEVVVNAVELMPNGNWAFLAHYRGEMPKALKSAHLSGVYSAHNRQGVIRVVN